MSRYTCRDDYVIKDYAKWGATREAELADKFAADSGGYSADKLAIICLVYALADTAKEICQ